MRAAHDLRLSLRDGTNRLVSRLSKEQTALTIVIAVGVLYIVSNARFGLVDPMAWRQADHRIDATTVIDADGVTVWVFDESD